MLRVNGWYITTTNERVKDELYLDGFDVVLFASKNPRPSLLVEGEIFVGRKWRVYLESLSLNPNRIFYIVATRKDLPSISYTLAYKYLKAK